VIFADQYCHASLRSGFTLSGAEIVFFKHNNFKDCEEKIKKYSSKVKKLLVMESVYSMDGNIGDLPKAKSLC
jgi:8-amino-7-oxononanoate synthase